MTFAYEIRAFKLELERRDVGHSVSERRRESGLTARSRTRSLKTFWLTRCISEYCTTGVTPASRS